MVEEQVLQSGLCITLHQMPQRYIHSLGTARASWRSWMQDPLGQELQHLQKLIGDWLEAENLSTTF